MSSMSGAGSTLGSQHSSGQGHAHQHSSGGAAGGRYKAITRDLLISVCKKHFSSKAIGASISGSMRGAGKHASAASRDLAATTDDFSREAAFVTRQESIEHYLKRATHLQLDNLRLTHTFPVPELALAAGQSSLDGNLLSTARNLRVLYLHDNALTTLDNFAFAAAQLSHLYLQNNRIGSMLGSRGEPFLLPLQKLEKLYLGGNAIQVLEGLAADEHGQQQGQQGQDGEQHQLGHDEQNQHGEQQQQQQHESGGGEQKDGSAQQADGDADGGGNSGGGQAAGRARAPPAPFLLTELHMDGQVLPAGYGLQLSLPSIQALSYSLQLLSLSHNHMDADSILPISLLSRLTSLNLSHNHIEDLAVVGELCEYLHDLTSMDLRENPINSAPDNHTAVKQKKYRDRIIMSSRSIVTLDDKPVPANQREYLHSLAAQKRLKRAQAAAAAASGDAPRQLSEEEKKFAALHAPPAFPYAPKVLTLRTTPLPGSGSVGVNVGHVGGFGARVGGPQGQGGGGGGGSHGGGGAHQHQQASYGASPFLDDDDNLGGGGDGGGGGGGGYGFDGSDTAQPAPAGAAAGGGGGDSSSIDASGTASSMTFTGDPRRLNDLLSQRGLVSAFSAANLHTSTEGDGAGGGHDVDPAAAESARNRRASMNALNQMPNGWDGGRTAHAPIVAGAHSRSGSSAATPAPASASQYNGTPSRTHSRSSSKPTTGK